MNRRIRILERSVLVGLALACVGTLVAQVPTKCLEIESILVDACNPSSTCPGSDEGQNEMVRFRVGPAPIALGELEADWPNNSWLGLVQDATTASLTSQLNATITSCGLLLEPPLGIIPAGSTVLLVTSTDMCVAGNSFAALTDTLYLIFQNAGNTSGHFANSPAAGQPISPTPPTGSTSRTLILFHNPSGCSDTATYVRQLLVNSLGTYGGENGECDGGTVEYSWPGVPVATYVNQGCQAPFVPVIVDATVVGSLCGGTGTVDLSGTVSGGAFTSVQWSGGTGTFGDPNALVTTYTAGAGDLGTVVLTLCAQTDCADPICGTVQVASGSGPVISIAGNGPLAICPGQQVVLTASGADTYVWEGGLSGPSITVDTPGMYVVTGTDACGTAVDSVEVTAASGVVITITGSTTVCPGGSTTLTANGATSYVWSTGEITPSITVTTPGTYTVNGSSSCGSATQSAIVTFGSAPAVSVSGDQVVCAGVPATLTATSNAPVLWSTGEQTPSITVTAPGTYTATATNGCGSSSASMDVLLIDAPTVTISGVLAICPGQTTTLTASGADTYVWSDGSTGAVISVAQPGPITVTGTSACGTDAATVTITTGESPTVEITGGTLLCAGASIVLTASSNAPITWNTGATGSSITVNNPGLYTVTATNACGTDSDGHTVDASPLEAGIAATPLSGTVPLQVQFTNTSTAGASSAWDFGGLGTSTSTAPVFTFQAPGSYLVTLEVALGGCTAEAVVLINVIPPPAGTASSISLPNVFTPNNDRTNDVLSIQAVNIVSVEVLIYNRWGQKVNELRRVGEVWDGRSMSGNLVPDGTYFYTLNALGTDGVTHTLTGHITVVR